MPAETLPEQAPPLAPPAPEVEIVVPRPSLELDAEPLGNGVFVVEAVECHRPHEALTRVFRGEPQSGGVVTLLERYAVWFDARRGGVSDEGWFCATPHRFCYGAVDFTKWSGHLRVGDRFEPDGPASPNTSEGSLIRLVISAVEARCRLE